MNKIVEKNERDHFTRCLDFDLRNRSIADERDFLEKSAVWIPWFYSGLFELFGKIIYRERLTERPRCSPFKLIGSEFLYVL